MASVTSLDQDMRKLRLDRYTPEAAKEIRNWIEESLGESLPSGDLMDVLKNGVTLCKLVNQAVSPGVRYKSSNMPFVQMENISHFLKACEMPPLSLPAHDRFLTVDLYDQKDPAQVLQCIAAFSRRANAIKPSIFPNTIGAKSKGGAMSPQGTGGSQKTAPYTMNAPPPKHEPVTAFNSLNRASYSNSPSKPGSLARGGLASPAPVSSWSSQVDENKTAPAWNIHQYGYMGGASQGNQGVTFGARRQLTSQAPHVPSLAEKEKRRKQIEEQRLGEQEEEEQTRIRAAEQEEFLAKEDEERRWQQETNESKEEEEAEQEAQRQRVNTQAEEEQQQQQQQRHEAKLAAQRTQQRQASDSRLNGQFLSQYQAGKQSDIRQEDVSRQTSAESQRIAELERQLAEMKEAERKREQLQKDQPPEKQARKAAALTRPLDATQEPHTSHEDDWDASERDFLKKQWKMVKDIEAEDRTPPKSRPSDALSRPLPDPKEWSSGSNRTGRYLSSNPAPMEETPNSHRPADFSTTTEVDLENQRRVASQQKTKAGAWASKSLLEREMERERQRQREWEEERKPTA